MLVPHHASAAEFDAFMARNPGVTSVDAVFVDLNGQLRGKRVPVAEARRLFTSGLQMPEDIFMLDARGEMTDPLGRGFGDGDPDGTAYAVPGALATLGPPPFTRAQVLMTMTGPDGAPTDVEPRNVLARVADQFTAATGLKPVTAFELEFFLIDPARAPAGVPQPPICPTTGERERAISVYGIWDLDRYDAFIQDVAAECERQNIPATTAVAEYAPGQFEINLRHVDDPLDAADDAALLRPLIKQVARAHNMQATFMAKPYQGMAGSGMHVHISLARDGRNAFESESGVSPLLRQAIGGLAETLHEAMAFFAPNANAYRRFAPNLFVPVNRRWGVNNRSTGLRVPAGEADAARVEHRFAGADANPYLVLAAILTGMRHGIANAIDPGPPHEGNATDYKDPTIPFEMLKALDVLQNGSVMRAALGGYVDIYAEAKRIEYGRFVATIPAHEYEWYL